MKLRPLIRALTLSALGVLGLGIAAGGCGQDVASCGNVCPTGASVDCPTSCSALQASCDSANAGADFQALLTCIANASGSLSPLPSLCTADFAIVSNNCGVPAETLPDAGSGTSVDGG